MNKPIGKFAVVSHVLPPSPSGQATVLYWLLKDLAPENYCLISREDYNKVNSYNTGTEKVAARYHTLVSPRQFHRPNRFKLNRVREAVNWLIAIGSRARQIAKAVKAEKAKLIIACTGDLLDLPAAYLASRWLRIPFIPYIFDDYAYQWMGKQRVFAKKAEPFILKGSRRIIVPNEYMAEEYKGRYGLESSIIRNLCPLPELRELDLATTVFAGNDINIVYTGSVYHAHYDAFRNLIKAIENLGRSDVKLHIFTSQPKCQLDGEGICGSNVIYHEHISHAEVPRVLRQSDILFLPLAFNSPIPEVIKTSAPGKMGEYLSVGRPIIAHAPQDSFVSWYFREHKCGLVVDELSCELMQETLCKAIEDKENNLVLGDRARIQAEQDFDLELNRVRFLHVLDCSLEEDL